MEADDDDSNDDQEMGEVENVEMFSSDLRQRGDEDDRKDEDSSKTGKDERGSPNTQRGRVSRPCLVVQICRVEDWEHHLERFGQRVEHRDPRDIEEPMEEHEGEEGVRRQHMECESRRHRELEEGGQRAVPRDGNQNHSHRDITNMARQRDGRKASVSHPHSVLDSPLLEILLQSCPPHSHNDSIQRHDPEETQQAAESELLSDEGNLSIEQGPSKHALHGGMEGANGQKGDGDGDPEIPDHDVQSCLEGKEPFSASSSVAIVIGSKSETDGKEKGQEEAASKWIETSPGSNSGHCAQ